MTGGLLSVALGRAGSGRQRYAEAMALYQAGALSADQLEAYRVAAASDSATPVPLLRERGLPVPKDSAEQAIRRLVDAADHYLSGLPQGPGLADVRHGLARFGSGPVQPGPLCPNAVVEAYLPAALEALSGTHSALADSIAAALPYLNWITYDDYDPDRIGPAFAKGHAYASILGEQAAIMAHDFDFGLFLIAPHVLYRDHNHAAPELYAPLTGPHGWRFAPDQPLEIRPAHEPIWNPPFQPHLTKVGPSPFLCFFCWTRDVAQAAQVIPASDWTELEALRLDP